jgi:hypothetical protein
VVEAARLLLLNPKALAAAGKAWAKLAAEDPRQPRLFGKAATPAEAWAAFLKAGGVRAEAPAAPPAPPPAPPAPEPTLDLFAQPKPAAQPAAPAPESDEAAFAREMLEIGKGLGPEERWGDGRVYLRALYDAIESPPPFEEWAAELLAAHKAGALHLAGGAQASAMDAKLWEASAVPDGAQTWRFLVTDAPEAASPPPGEPPPAGGYPGNPGDGGPPSAVHERLAEGGRVRV